MAFSCISNRVICLPPIVFLLTSTFFPENKEISAPPPCGFLIETYIFYENWSTETFRNKESKKWVSSIAMGTSELRFFLS
jgi:hypothetical protein